jgi:anhydro-N-acetylmuramic acid kinase
MQIGQGALIAEQNRITTVADFRMTDIALGGQGAPLTPKYHQYLLQGSSGVVINLGGIANISLINNQKVIGFDTGPANTLLDNWIKKHKNQNYDRDGLWARTGIVDEELLNRLLADDYFCLSHPKSTGTEYFNLEWLDSLIAHQRPEDVQRTLVELTSRSISTHIPTGSPVFLCGGGVHNLFLSECLAYQNPKSCFDTTLALGIHPDYVEAAAFAYFAQQTLNKKSLDMTQITGASKACMMGAVHYVI